jgi:hypothetical protein
MSKTLTHFTGVVQYRPISMKPVLCFETKSKRKPNFATSVVGFGLVLVNQEKDKLLS